MNKTSLSLPFIIFLALLGVPRIIGHDLGLLQEGNLLNALFVFVPFIVWMLVLLIKKVNNPIKTGILIGLVYGIFLTIIHQLLGGLEGITLGGNLSHLSGTVQQIIIRSFSTISSMVVGTGIGLVIGCITYFIQFFVRKIR